MYCFVATSDLLYPPYDPKNTHESVSKQLSAVDMFAQIKLRSSAVVDLISFRWCITPLQRIRKTSVTKP